MKNKLLSPQIFTLIACLGLALAPIGCAKDEPADDMDGDTTGDGDGDPGDGDGDGDTTTGDGDGDPTTGDGDGDGDTATGDGDGDPMGDLPNGAPCTSGAECLTGQCYIVPLLGGQCGECDHDDDCPDGGCTAPNPFENNGPTCNMGEAGGGCESDEVCEDGLSCGNVLSLLQGLIEINTCGVCATDDDCNGQICAPIVVVENFDGQNMCIDENSLPQDSFCNLEGNGDMACENVCSVIDIMGLAEVGACGECNSDEECNGGTCQFGDFDLETGTLSGSVCVN
ncbi:hypothetical protein DB30_03712 [Enhygromyxa salina]|uniref:Endo-1,4-beta-xylanase A n=1 Tax=Enhygromyxa salina TaxID=215803 RepID=A0A0C2D623_9BACT|nr:hypothetical protein [Enhygromyxa salina]KIG17115.1 hypothetical protein DB30_03712 [Enhygromyxa salina]